jgi:hybrid cluster-associated redox disulfide protein
MKISEKSKISDVLTSHPETLGVFLKYGLACIGCSVSGFETVQQGGLAHGFDENTIKQLVEELKEKSKQVVLTEKAAEKLKEFKKGKNLILRKIQDKEKSFFDLEFGKGEGLKVKDKGFIIIIEAKIIGEVKGMTIDWVEGKGLSFKRYSQNSFNH